MLARFVVQAGELPEGIGPLARREWTSGSDVDWTLLIDGQSLAGLREVAPLIANAVQRDRDKGLGWRIRGAGP
ncbi:MAG: hypothetical protein ACOX1P_30960 [Thermoguttaceae bacterium]